MKGLKGLLLILALPALLLAACSQAEAQPTVTPSGLQIEVLVEGDGPAAFAGHTAIVHHTGWLTDGTRFDSSLDRSNARGEPFQFYLGGGTVIKGWDEGIIGMKVGGKRKLTIPPELAYGEHGVSGVIPPGATLVFEVELLDVY